MMWRKKKGKPMKKKILSVILVLGMVLSLAGFTGL